MTLTKHHRAVRDGTEQPQRIAPAAQRAAPPHRHGAHHRADLQAQPSDWMAVYDCRENRKAIFNRRVTPKIPAAANITNVAASVISMRPSSRSASASLMRVFAWENIRRLLLRFERISEVHYALNARLHPDQPAALLS
jgi:hypothetical protein